MAKEITAIFKYTPRVNLGKIVEIDELVSFIIGRTTFNEGAVVALLMELRDALRFFVRSGRPVRLNELGIIGPRINKDGRIGITFKADPWLKSELNVPGTYNGDIINKDMINKSLDEVIERWNREHPDDPIDKKSK